MIFFGASRLMRLNWEAWLQRNRIFMDGGHGTDDQVGTGDCRVIRKNIQAGTDAGTNDHGLVVGDLMKRLPDRVGHRRHNRRNNGACQIFCMDMIELQNGLKTDGIFQNCFVGIRGHSFRKKNFVIFDTADDDVCVSDIDR